MNFTGLEPDERSLMPETLALEKRKTGVLTFDSPND